MTFSGTYSQKTFMSQEAFLQKLISSRVHFTQKEITKKDMGHRTHEKESLGRWKMTTPESCLAQQPTTWIGGVNLRDR